MYSTGRPKRIKVDGPKGSKRTVHKAPFSQSHHRLLSSCNVHFDANDRPVWLMTFHFLMTVQLSPLWTVHIRPHSNIGPLKWANLNFKFQKMIWTFMTVTHVLIMNVRSRDTRITRFYNRLIIISLTRDAASSQSRFVKQAPAASCKWADKGFPFRSK